MNQLPLKYNPAEVEDRWYAFWVEHNLFHSEPDSREPYTIVIPPPNVTGVLHMGHMLNNTIQDILVRRARMLGYNALWVPGTDHASIATETKVIAKLDKEGIKKTDLTREEFLVHAWDWTRTHGGIILQQLRKLGASCDWERTAFTMDEPRSQAVVKVFCDLYDKGYIYRGLRPVNWDPKNRTAISDDEVFYFDEMSKLYYLKYYVADDDFVTPEGEGNVIHKDSEGRRYAVVATTRPETIMGDTAMCINPKDPKNAWLRGRKVIVPLVGRVVPVIEDRYVDIEFGTGCLKVTPAHDKNDYALGQAHNLETIDIFNEDATIAECAGMYVGMDRFECRKAIAKDLEDAGLLEKVEDYENKVGYSERTKVAIEPRLSLQWFLNMKHFAEIALPPVEENIIRFVPEKYKNTYRTWMEGIKDWCISRQLWWGHRIPAYYFTDPTSGEEKIVVAPTAEEALAKAKEFPGCGSLCAEDLVQDPDALDTWFSSWLWPITLFDGINNPGNKEIEYYYPTATLVTGPDIIFFWVARMVMAGYEYIGKEPFKNVYFTGIVRDKLGRKMSKQLGNSPDPLDLIATYGADGVRMGMMLAAPAGNDIMFDEALCEQGRNFCNKIWNSFRLLQGWTVDSTIEQPALSKLAAKWFGARLSKTIAEVDDLFDKFRINEALMAVYRLFCDDFSALYLEMIKPAYLAPIDAQTRAQAGEFLDALLRLIHPFMPFITEELWQHLAERAEGESIMVSSMPRKADGDETLIEPFAMAAEIVSAIRAERARRGISPREMLTLKVLGTIDNRIIDMISKLGGLEAVEQNSEKDPVASSFLVGTLEFNIPRKAEAIDVEAERAKITKEIQRLEGFRMGIEKKLSNERFVNSAPEAVVAGERKKLADTDSKLETLKQTLASLG